MDISKLKRTFAAAAEIAEGLPEELREAGFNRALDMLTQAAVEKGGIDALFETSSAEALLARMTATRDAVLAQSLQALRVAGSVLGIENMTAEQIGAVLQSRFGIPVNAERVARALEGADDFVQQLGDTGTAIYRMIRPEPQESGQKKPAAKKKVATGKGAKAKKAEPATITDLLIDLVRGGFFASARTVRDVLLYLEKKGLEITQRELSAALLRLFQRGLLQREKPARGPFRYRSA